MIDWTDVEFIQTTCASAYSYSDACRRLNLNPQSSIRTLKKYINTYNIDITHFTPYKFRTPRTKQVTPLSEVLVINSSYSRYHLKKRLIREGVLVDECNQCGIEPLWNGILLVMQLDHINGINTDNRLINIRLLCPNCHSQTSTFAGKNKKN